MLLAVGLLAAAGLAHEGEEHAPEPTPAATPDLAAPQPSSPEPAPSPSPGASAAPRATTASSAPALPPDPRTVAATEGSSARFEVLALLPPSGGEARLYLADAATNAPVAGASLSLRLQGPTPAEISATGSPSPTAAEPAPGIYRGALPPLRPGTYEATAAVTEAGGAVEVVRLAPLTVSAPSTPAAPASAASRWIRALAVVPAALLVLVALAVAASAWRRGRAADPRSTLPLLLLLLAAPPLHAHGGEDHADEASRPAAVAASEPGAIALEKEAQFALGIRTEPARLREVEGSIEALGKVEAPPWARARIGAPQTARVSQGEEHAIPAFGSPVTKGQVLAYLAPVAAGTERVALVSERLKLEAEVERARGDLALKKAESERLASLEAVVAKKELLQAQVAARTAESALSTAVSSLALHRSALGEGGDGAQLLPLRSPIDGVIAYVHAAYGEQVEQGKVLFEIVDPAALWVEAQIYEADLGRIPDGARARVELDALPGTVLEGRLTALGSIVDEGTRTTTAVVAFDPPSPASLRVGLLARVHIVAGAAHRGIAVPRAALLEDEGGPALLVKRSARTFARVGVRPGATDGLFTIVEGAVAEGDRVVTQGAAALKEAAAAQALGAATR